ncbi:MAG: hypothetical protein JJ895_11440 [Balneolaceae bacterium]|nr:hypothetical protein [Balneolaceae bacterium]
MNIKILLFTLICVGYLLTGISRGSQEILGETVEVNTNISGVVSISDVDVPEVWVAVARTAVAVGRVTVAATRQAVAVARVYTPEAGNLARAARISIAIVYNFNKHIKANFPEKEFQEEFRMWELDNA